MESAQAAHLVELAQRCGVSLASAPCSILSETAQTMWKALADGAVGRVRLVYANFDDGMVHSGGWARWRSASGAPWPAKDEFEVGCTYEHAGYVLTWLAAFFGPARRVQAFARCLVPDKGVAVRAMAPDFSVGCIEYDNGVVARVTCGVVAPVDKSLTIIGDDGTLYTRHVRDDASPVYLRRTHPNPIASGLASRWTRMWNRIENALHLPFSIGRFQFEGKIPHACRPRYRSAGSGKPVDFLRGPAEQAKAIHEGRRCRLSAELGVHLVEVVEALQHPERFGGCRTITSTFEPISPLRFGRGF